VGSVSLSVRLRGVVQSKGRAFQRSPLLHPHWPIKMSTPRRPRIQLAIVPYLRKPDPGADPPTPHTFQRRLDNALRDPTLQSCHEDTERAVRALLQHDVTVNMDLSQHSLGRFIVQTLLQPTSSYNLKVTIDHKEPMTVPANTRLLFVHLAKYLDCTIYLFSNRSAPRVYRSSRGSRVCAILHCVDSYRAHSEYLVLTIAAHLQFGASSTAPSSSLPPPVPLSQPPPVPLSQHTQHARYRNTRRPQKRGRVKYEEDEKDRMKDALRAGW